MVRPCYSQQPPAAHSSSMCVESGPADSLPLLCSALLAVSMAHQQAKLLCREDRREGSWQRRLGWTGSCWDAHTAAGLSLPSSAQLQWVPSHLGDSSSAQAGGPEPRTLSQVTVWPGASPGGSIPQQSLWTESVFHFPPKAVHWGKHIPATMGSSGGHGTSSHGQVNCWLKWKLMELHWVNRTPRQ